MEASEYYRYAQQRQTVAMDMVHHLLRICPDSQLDPTGAAGNTAARAALRAACDIIEHNPPREWVSVYLQGHWTGVIEAALKVISAVELDLWDPRTYPERYAQRSGHGGT